MSKQKNKNLVLTLFSKRPKVGEYTLYPLTAGRIALLEDKGNKLFAGVKEGDSVDSYDVFEAFMVSVSSGEELAELSILSDEDWKIATRAFGFDLEDQTLMDFWDVVEAERKAISAARAVPKKKRARRASRT
mgnify:CR=1 FL=1|tara:strand:- start:1234 stop:1629 length:396 start_codon:yes stop_codon:yes gene_type:complete